MKKEHEREQSILDSFIRLDKLMTAAKVRDAFKLVGIPIEAEINDNYALNS